MGQTLTAAKKVWRPLAECQVCGSPNVAVMPYADPDTGYRDEAYVCDQGHRVDEEHVDAEDVEPELPMPRLIEHDGARYLNGERILTVREAAACVRIDARITEQGQRAWREAREEDARSLYRLLGAVQYRQFGSCSLGEL